MVEQLEFGQAHFCLPHPSIVERMQGNLRRKRLTILRLIRQNLFYFRGVNIAVVFGVAVATAVLSGALMVGDSVRASLAELAVQRLGKIDDALIAGRFVDASLARRMEADPSIHGQFDIEPAIIVRGGAAVVSGSERTAGVQIIGVDGEFIPIPAGECVLNGQTASALDIKSFGSEIDFSVPTGADEPREAALSQRSRDETIAGLHAWVLSIETTPGMISLFAPGGSQRTPQNAWVNLADLQNTTGQRGRANAFFVHDITAAQNAAGKLNAALRRSLTLADYGLTFSRTSDGSEAALLRGSIYLDPPIEPAADQAARE